MIDSFICTQKNRNPDRDYFFYITDISFTIAGLRPKIVIQPMLKRYLHAEKAAKTAIYIFSDDDIVPENSKTLEKLVYTLSIRPEYGMIGLSWKRGLTCEEMGKWCLGEDEGILEMDHIGGIMAIRKGIIEDTGDECDYENGYGDDKVIGNIVRQKGYKVGILPNDIFHHLGAGYTSVWQKS